MESSQSLPRSSSFIHLFFLFWITRMALTRVNRETLVQEGGQGNGALPSTALQQICPANSAGTGTGNHISSVHTTARTSAYRADSIHVSRCLISGGGEWC